MVRVQSVHYHADKYCSNNINSSIQYLNVSTARNKIKSREYVTRFCYIVHFINQPTPSTGLFCKRFRFCRDIRINSSNYRTVQWLANTIFRNVIFQDILPKDFYLSNLSKRFQALTTLQPSAENTADLDSLVPKHCGP